MGKAMEHRELQEKVEHAVETAHHAGGKFPAWTRQLSLSTAVIAVLTAVSSLGAEYLSHHALMYKNDMVYTQAKATDQWGYFQAKGIKGMVSAGFADSLKDNQPARAQRYNDEALRYKNEQADLKKEADALEEKVQWNNEQAERCIKHHHDFSIAVTLFQVTIALSAIAVLIWRRDLWILGLMISVAAGVFLLKGLVYFV